MTTQTIQVWVGAGIIYVYGTVNGEPATFTLVGAGAWQAEVPRSEDNSYAIHLEAYSENGLEGAYDYILYYGMLPLITDRTQADVARARTLRFLINANGWDSLTEAERAEWLGGLRGAYNYTDLNRVGQVVSYLAGELNLYGYAVAVTPKIDWVREDIPRPAEMAVYLTNVAAIKDKFYGTAPLPGSMEKLTTTGANNIELLLQEVYTYIERMQQGFRKCGTFRSGQGVILP